MAVGVDAVASPLMQAVAPPDPDAATAPAMWAAPSTPTWCSLSWLEHCDCGRRKYMLIKTEVEYSDQGY